MSTLESQLIDSTMQVDDKTNQYLTFMLDGEEYGVNILRVQEIKGWDTVTPIPNTPEYVLGVINLRGTVVPVINLRKRFGLDGAPFNATTVIIVVKVFSEEGDERTMGIVVDAVSEVYNISNEDKKPAPDFGGSISSSAITGLATLENKMVILLDIDQLMNSTLHEEDLAEYVE